MGKRREEGKGRDWGGEGGEGKGREGKEKEKKENVTFGSSMVVPFGL